VIWDADESFLQFSSKASENVGNDGQVVDFEEFIECPFPE
jgi:hypothetical protein